MLDNLRSIVQEVSSARNLDQVLEVLVHRVRKTMGVDVCSVYLTDEGRKEHILMATEGLKPGSVGEVRLSLYEGLIGVVSARSEPVNLEDAPSHPQYRYFEQTGEERYHGFLGVPMIQHRRVLGVLVVQQRRLRRFTDQEESFLLTLAAQLAGTIAHAELNGGVSSLIARTSMVNKLLEGVAGGPGVAIGQAVVIFPASDLSAVPDRQTDDVEQEISHFKQAVETVLGEFREISKRMGESLPAEERVLFDAYALMLQDGSLISDTIEGIQAGNWAPGALRQTIDRHMRVFDEMEDPYLRERGSDIQDLGRRVLECLENQHQGPREYPPNTILVGEEIGPAHLMDVPREHLVGVVSGQGSVSSHVAILARALSVPAVMGVSDQITNGFNGQEAIIDGYRGRVYIQPSEVVRSEFVRLSAEERELAEGLEDLQGLPAETPDGVNLPLHVNTGLLSDIAPAIQSGADGVGLYRTEFPFMVSDSFPGENDQCHAYRQILSAFAPKPVTLRTLDAGGDKPLPYFPINEDNPFLGWRGIRISLEHPEIFITQLRAMLLANEGNENLCILFPMISGIDELDEALGLLVRAEQELRDEGHTIRHPKVGVMVEVPSIVYQTAAVAKRVDYLSVGSNDLTQYLLAVDRNNPHVAELYNSLHPAVLKAIHSVVKEAHRLETPVSVCGEMAGDPRGAILLLGMGIDSLSMNVSALPRIKWVIRSFSKAHAEALLARALRQEDGNAIRRLMNNALEEAGLGGLVRAGK